MNENNDLYGESEFYGLYLFDDYTGEEFFALKAEFFYGSGKQYNPSFVFHQQASNGDGYGAAYSYHYESQE